MPRRLRRQTRHPSPATARAACTPTPSGLPLLQLKSLEIRKLSCDGTFTLKVLALGLVLPILPASHGIFGPGFGPMRR
jgi:hypothetical protein